MARIAGINIPQNKVVSIALTYIHGIGLHSSKKICKKLDIPSSKRVNELSEEQVLKIREFIDANHKVEGDLRREVSVNIKRLVDLACYRGTRHKKKLPVRGQRTQCNARTRKGKAIAIAGINIPQNKVVSIALTYIHGIGPFSSKKICEKLNIPSSKRVNELTEEQVLKIREFIDANHKVEGDLRREVSVNIKRLVDLACYRGTRHKKKLPVRGQRTQCNARTRKGKAIAIAGKKLTPLKK